MACTNRTGNFCDEMVAWVPKRETPSARLHDAPFSCGQSVQRPFQHEFDTGDGHRSFKREVSRSKMVVRDQGSLLVNVIGFVGDGNWTTTICFSPSKLLCLGSASVSRFLVYVYSTALFVVNAWVAATSVTAMDGSRP